ncbi:MAG: Unknown protein [uncultured Sulfurovum sp.]|uniref:ATP-dependent DNA ligase n=1 Tax=uncultured Sulfurovum sp. TaxID=269237 RepID=A0A6S6U3Q4_9BACT|nr:MAG: Unknown protein [uncultured Sulfurovum sp.]
MPSLGKVENITLFYKQERSDKVYKAFLEEQDDNYVVNFAYGRRGSTLKTGTKTQTAIPYEKAKKIYDKLVLSKSVKGYVPDEDSSAYVVDNEQRKTGIHCQLLNPIEELEVESFLRDDNWCMQEKKDGKRMLIQKVNNEIIAINRKGLSVGVPETILTSAGMIEDDFIIDGEAIGDKLYVFDILSFNKDIKAKSYEERYRILTSLPFSNAIEVVDLVRSHEDKERLFQVLREQNAEGVVFKKFESSYTAGRPNSAGTQIKFKFYETASVIVSKVNDKRSVGMALFKDGEEIFVGNVTISTNKEVPKERDIIEVRYLYAYKGGSLYQPTFLEIRTDIDELECRLEQLKYKVAV